MKKIFFTICLFTVAIGFPQDFKPGKVSVKELQEAVHPLDPSASAAILNKSGKTHFDFDNEGNWIVVTEVTTRIKIYNKGGFAYAVAEIPFKTKDEVVFQNAASYNLEGNKVKKTIVKEDKQSEQATNNVKKISFTDIKEGTVIEYTYIYKSSDVVRLPDWYFQHEIPVNSAEYNVHIPLYFVYNRLLSPYVPVNEKQDAGEQTRYFSNPGFRGAITKINPALQAEGGNVTYPVAIKTYSVQNVPALRDGNFIDNIKNYRSFVKHELATLQYPNSPKKIYTADWETVVKSMYYEDGFGIELEREDYFAKDINTIMEKTQDRKELVKVIFDHVKNRMSWNGVFGYATTGGIGTAYMQKSGNVAEINLMLIAMLRYAGYKASPVLVSTRDNGHITFVSHKEFNYVIAGLETTNGTILLDATSKNAVPGILPSRAINGNGRIIRDNLTSEEISLVPVSPSRESSAIVAKIEPDGTMTGHVKNYYFDQKALEFRDNPTSIKQDHSVVLKERFDDCQISDVTLLMDDFTKPVIEDFSFNNSNFAEVKGDRLYISPMLMYTVSQNPFSETKRTWPIDFVYPQQKKYTYSITIPDGYAVESIPQPAAYTIKDNAGGFRYSISSQQNQVQIVVNSDINYAMLGADYYPALKEFYDSIIKKQSEKIVLKKI